MSRKYIVVACCLAVFAAFIGSGYFLYRNTNYLKHELRSTFIGPVVLDIYRSLKIDALFSKGEGSIDTEKITYSIFDTSPSLKTDSNDDRLALPEFKVIAGLDDEFLKTNRVYPSTIDFTKWQRGHGGDYSSKYSQLDSINRQNVRRLKVAWIYHSGEKELFNVETNPIFADGKVFVTSPGGYLIAIDAITGIEKWRNKIVPGPARRGMLWWAGNDKVKPRLFVPSVEGTYAVDPESGLIITSFGNGGSVGVSSFVPPVVDGNRLIVATRVPAVEAYDVETGRPLWKTGLLKSDTPDGGMPWGGFSFDKKRSRVYVTTGNPRPQSYGITRLGRNEYTDSVVSIDTVTGKIDWSFQEVAHDLWDFDVPSPPVLTTIRKAGHAIDVVAAVTKIGNTLLLERDTGKPVFDYRLRRAPVSDVPGEKTWPYQPAVELPEPFAKLTFEPSDITNIGEAQKAAVERKLRNAKFGFFVAPAINAKAVMFGLHGGGEWPGAAVDQETGIMYVPTNQFPWIVHLHYSDHSPNPIRSMDKEGDALYQFKCATCHGVNREGHYEREYEGDRFYPSLVGFTANRDVSRLDQFQESHAGLAPLKSITNEELKRIDKYLRTADHISDDRRSLSVTSEWVLLLDNEGYPASAPPWGSIVAVDLNSGKKVWQVPFGEYPELTKRGIPITGQKNFGGVIVTKGGLVFATGTIDQKVRAFDSSTGEQLWDYDLPSAGTAPPSTYEVNGIQYIVVVGTGGQFLGYKGHSDTIIAFKLN